MRVLFLVSTGKDTGIYTSAIALAEKLKQKGIHVDIDKPFSLKYDIIHIHNPLPANISLSKMVYWNKPIVATTNMTQDELKGLIPGFAAGIAKNYLDFFYANCDKIIATSPKIFGNLKNSPHAGKTVFLRHGIELKNFKKNEKAGKDFKKKWNIKKPMVFSAASVQKRKGIFDFAKAARKLKKFQFVWAGTVSKIATLEDRDEIEKLTEDKNSNIIFTGFLTAKELEAAYSASDLFVFPTHAETFGLVAVEAAANGIPVLMRNLPELENFSKFALKFENEKDLVKKIEMVLKNKKEWKKLSRSSLKHSKEFDLENVSKQVISIYKGQIECNEKDFLKKIMVSGKDFEKIPEKIRKQLHFVSTNGFKALPEYFRKKIVLSQMDFEKFQEYFKKHLHLTKKEFEKLPKKAKKILESF